MNPFKALFCFSLVTAIRVLRLERNESSQVGRFQEYFSASKDDCGDPLDMLLSEARFKGLERVEYAIRSTLR